MKYSIKVFIVFLFVINTNLYAEKYIYGSVNKRSSIMGEDRPLPGVNVKVVIPANFKGNDVSDSTGDFKLKIPNWLNLESVKKIKISSIYDSDNINYRMLYPFEGEYHIPEDLELEPLKIKMIPSSIFERVVTAEVQAFKKNEELITLSGSKEWNISLAVSRTAKETGLSEQQYLNDIKAMTSKIASNPEIYNNQQIYNYARLKNSYFEKKPNYLLTNQEVMLISQEGSIKRDKPQDLDNESTPHVQNGNSGSFRAPRVVGGHTGDWSSIISGGRSATSRGIAINRSIREVDRAMIENAIKKFNSRNNTGRLHSVRPN